MQLAKALDTNATLDPIAVAPNLTEHTETNQTVVQDVNTDASPIKDRAYFAKAIRLRWNKARESILEVGRLIIEARKTLSPEEFSKFRKLDLPFDYSVLQKLCALAESARINDPNNKRLLPHSWNTLYEIVQLPDEAFEFGVKEGIINEKTPWKKIKDLRQMFDPPLKAPKASTPQASPRQNNSGAALPESLFESEPKAEGKETTPPASESTKTEAPLDKAAEEIASLTAKLYEGTSQLPQAVSVPTPAKGHVTVTLSRQVADCNQGAVEAIRKLIEGVVRPYDFMDSLVTLEVV